MARPKAIAHGPKPGTGGPKARVGVGTCSRRHQWWARMSPLAPKALKRVHRWDEWVRSCSPVHLLATLNAANPKAAAQKSDICVLHFASVCCGAHGWDEWVWPCLPVHLLAGVGRVHRWDEWVRPCLRVHLLALTGGLGGPKAAAPNTTRPKAVAPNLAQAGPCHRHLGWALGYLLGQKPCMWP